MCTYNHIHTMYIYICTYIHIIPYIFIYIYIHLHIHIYVYLPMSPNIINYYIMLFVFSLCTCFCCFWNKGIITCSRFFLPGAQQCLWRSFVSQHDGCKTQAEFQTLRPTVLVGLWIWVLQSHTLQSHRSGFASSCLFNYRCRWKNWKMKHLLPKDGYKSRH